MYKDWQCSLKYNQPVQIRHACLISCYVSIFSKQPSSKRCIQVMSSSYTQSVSVAAVYLPVLAFYPRHRLQHDAASSHSEKSLFRSESRKSQVRKKQRRNTTSIFTSRVVICFFFFHFCAMCTQQICLPILLKSPFMIISGSSQ